MRLKQIVTLILFVACGLTAQTTNKSGLVVAGDMRPEVKSDTDLGHIEPERVLHHLVCKRLRERKKNAEATQVRSVTAGVGVLSEAE